MLQATIAVVLRNDTIVEVCREKLLGFYACVHPMVETS